VFRIDEFKKFEEFQYLFSHFQIGTFSNFFILTSFVLALDSWFLALEKII